MLNLKQKFSQSSGNGIVPRLPRSLSCVHLLAMLYNTGCFLGFTWNNTVSFLTKGFVRDCLILFRIVKKNFLHNNAPLSYDLIYSRIYQNMQVTIVVQPAVRPIPCPLVISFFSRTEKKRLAGNKYETRVALISAVNRYSSRSTSWFPEGVQKLPRILQKCIDVNGEYFDKNLKNFLKNK